MDIQNTSNLVSAFKSDLIMRGDGAAVIRNVIQKHITTGDPVAITQQQYFELRRRVAVEFELHPSAVVLVGSCRLGFALKKKPPSNRRFEPCGPSSDLDVAVVSAELFDHFWDAVFECVWRQRDWSMGEGAKFTRDLFNGWFTPDNLPNMPQFARARKWAEFFDSINRERMFGFRRMSARLYRSWHRLEAYQEHMVRACKNELEDDRRERKSI